MDSNDEKSCTEPSSSFSQKNLGNEDLNENISEDEETSHVICTSNIFSTVEYENCNDINSRNVIHNSEHNNSSLFLKTFNSNEKANSSGDHLHIGSTSSEIFSSECEMEVEKLNCDTLNSGFESLSNEKEHNIYLKHLNPLVINVTKNSNESVSNQLNDNIVNVPGTGKSFNGIGKKSLNKSYFQRVFNEESKQKDKVNSSNKFSLFSLQLSKENKPNFNNTPNKSTLSYHVCDQDNSNPGPSQFVVFEEENLHDLRDDVCIVESSSKIIPNISHALDLRHTESSSGDNCIVSSSTGHLDPIDFNEQDYHSSSTTSPLNPPILDSTVDSTSEQNPLVSPFSDDSELSQKSEESDFDFSIYEHKRKMAITLSHKSENHDLNILADSHHSHHLEYQDSCQQPIVDNFLSLNNFNLQLQSSSMPDKSSDKLSSTFATLSSNYYIKNPECSSISDNPKESLHKVKHYRNHSSVTSDSNMTLSHESNFAYRDNSFESKSDKNLSEINNMALGISKIEPESSNLRAAPDIDNDVFSASCHELDISANNLTPGRTLTHLNERYLFSVEENSTSNDHALCLESIPEVGSKFNENLHVHNEHLRDKRESLESCSSKSEEAIMSNYQRTLELGLESHQLRDLINTRSKTNLDPSLLMDASDDNESPLKMNNAVDCSTVDCDSPKVFLNYISSSPQNLSSQESTFRETCKNNLVDSNLQGDDDLIDEKSTNSREYFPNVENCVSNNESKLPYSCSEQKMLDIIFSKYNDQKRSTSKLEKNEEERNDSASLKEKGYIYSDRIGPPQKFMDNWMDSEMDLENQNILGNEGFWCADCEKTLKTKCSFHRIKPVLDKPVLSRARASLPAQHLTFKYASNDVNKECCSGVLSRRSIPKRTQFGPLEGNFVLDAPIVHSLLFKVTQNNVEEFIDTSDEGSSNWMRFVRPANCQSDINCIVIEEEGQIYFLTTVHILPKTELRVWYSKQYALKYNFALIEDPDIDKEAEQRNLSCGSSSNNDEAISGSCNESPVRREKRRSCSKKSNIKPETSKQNVKRRLYDCAYCDLSFKENELLQLHSLEHSDQCVNDFHDDSGSVSESESSADVHSNNAKCPSCFKEFDTMAKLTEHVRDHSTGVVRDCEGQQSFKCDLCYKTFSERSRLLKHAESHKSDSQKPFECSRCIRRFCNKSALGSHLKLHIQGKGAKLYNCPICCENFYAVVTFKAHLSVHLIKGEYTCPSCSKKFQSYHKIRRHIRSYHTAVHPCQECGKVLPSVEKLKIHLLSHSDRRDFACPECSKRFKRKDKMKEHFKRIHSENNNNNNNSKKKCGQKFVPKVDPADYKQFMYKCYLCLLGFKRRGMLVNHLAKRHPGTPIESVPELNQPIVRSCHSYMCQYCGKTYGSTTKRKLHILKNHPGAELPQQTSMRNEDIKTMKTFAASCPWCPRQYATKAKLLQHQRHHHHHFSRPKNKEKVPRFKSQSTSESQVKDGPKDILSQALDKISNKPEMFGLNSENGVVEINVQSGQATNNQDYQKQNASTSSCGEVYVSPFVVPREGTYAVLTPDGSETFTLSLRNGQILPSVGTISVLTPETVSSNVELVQGSPARLLTLDGLQGTQFSADDVNCTKEDSCIEAQNESENTSVLIWQPSITYNPTS